MKLSTKHNPIGKPQGNFNAQTITIDWQSVDISPLSLVNHITAGMPFAVAQFRDGYRKTTNFIASDLIALDIDTNIDNLPLTEIEYQAVLKHPIITQFAFAVIQSFSSKEGAYKCRVLFQLSETITDSTEYKDLVTTLMCHVPYVDPAAKDAARAFFGGKPGRPADFLAPDNVLDVTWLREQLRRQKAYQERPLPKRQAPPTSIPKVDPSTTSLEQVRDALRYIPPLLDYDKWLAILMAIHSALPGPEGIALAEEWSPGYPGEVEKKFTSFTNARVSLGTLFYYAMQFGYHFPDAEPQPTHHLQMDRLPPGIKTIQVEERYLLTDGGENSNVTLLKSPIGTGKTAWIARNLPRDDSRILVISHRRSLARELTKRLNREFLDFELYENCANLHELLRSVPRLVITPNSLYKLLKPDGSLPSIYDIVVIDEMEQVLDHVTGNTLPNGMGIVAHELMIQFVKRAQKVIGADANLTNLSVEWMAAIHQEITLIHNTYRPQRGNLTLSRNRDQTLTLLIKDLQQAEQPVVIATDSKNQAKAIHHLLQKEGFKGIVIHADNKDSPENTAFLSDIDGQIGTLDYFIHSPTISAGVDIQAKVAVVYGFFFNQSITPEEQFQMLGRARKATRFVCYSMPVKRHQETNPTRIKADIIANLAKHARDYGFLMKWDEAGNMCIDAAQEAYLNLQCKFWAKRNRAMNRSRDIFLIMAKEEFSVGILLPPKSKQVSPAQEDAKEKIKAASQEVAKSEAELTLTCTPVNDIDHNRARLNGEMTPKIHFGHERYVIEEFYRQPITLALYKEARNTAHGGMWRLTNFINLHRDTSELVHMDREEDKGNFAYSRRNLDAQKINLIRQLLAVVFGNHIHTHHIPESELDGKLVTFNELYEQQNAHRILRRRTHSEENALKRFRWILSLMGLKLKKYRNRTTGTQSWGICPTRYAELIDLANVRLRDLFNPTPLEKGIRLVESPEIPRYLYSENSPYKEHDESEDYEEEYT
jgi:hypothetical protein